MDAAAEQSGVIIYLAFLALLVTLFAAVAIFSICEALTRAARRRRYRRRPAAGRIIPRRRGVRRRTGRR